MDVLTEEPKISSPMPREIPELSDTEVVLLLEDHQKWLESNGQESFRFSLCRANLERADLVEANLRDASLPEANLRGADLLLADLRGSCLIQANLQDANLSGARFQGANLQYAQLRGATGLLMEQLAGANLFAAVLPASLSESEETSKMDRISRHVLGLFVAMLSICSIAWLIIGRTTDAQLLKNSPLLPFRRLGDALPTADVYLLAPLLLLVFYIYFHCCMQRVWEKLAALPAIFSDGRRLDEIGPWFSNALVRKHLKWFLGSRPSLASLETALAAYLAYWLVPTTLLLFWGRYLTTQDLRGAMLHVLVVVASVGLASFLPKVIPATLYPEDSRLPRGHNDSHGMKLIRRGAPTAGAGVLLSMLSFGTICGVPHDASRAPEFTATNYRRWAADIFWLAGYNPLANLNEAVISTPLTNGKGQAIELAEVQGAHLNNLTLRYAQAYRAFLANAHLWHADFQGAYLSEADLRGAALRQADLRSATLDRALLGGADLEQSKLSKANLARADLRQANLTFASLERAILVDARLDGANLYDADLFSAFMARANLEKADLRDANLENADLAQTDLQDADLWGAKLPGARLQGARLGRAILIQANLGRADLSGAEFQGTLLRGADLQGANLDGADLRNAFGLIPSQICSAFSRRDVQLDSDLQSQTDQLCGTPEPAKSQASNKPAKPERQK